MDRAIDTFIPDNQIEVKAKDVNLSRTIRAAEKRYACPVCGEYVTYVPPIRRGKSIWKNAFFRHLTAESDATCDLRISSNSSLSFYERVGQSLYLISNGVRAFSLMMGFRGIGADSIQSYENNDASIIIKATSYNKDVYKISRQIFYYDELTLLPIHFTTGGSNYSIEVENATLNSKWSDFSEGLSSAGGVFEYGINGGKKIRKTNVISTNTKYFILILHSVENAIPSTLNYIYEGSLKLSGQVFKVGTICFNDDYNTNSFNIANAFLKSKFSIQLTKEESKLIPIWPPAISKYDTFTFEHGNQVLCTVKSSQSEPNVYQYIGSDIRTAKVDDRKIVSFYLQDREIPVSVDRHFFGKTYYINKNKTQVNAVKRMLVVMDNDHNLLELRNYKELPAGNSIKVKTTFPISILRQNINGNKLIHIETDSPVTIDQLQLGDFLIIYSDIYIGTLSFSSEKSLKKEAANSISEVIESLFNDKSPMVPVEWWINWFLNQEYLDKSLESLLVSYIKTGYMPINSKRILFDLMKENEQ